jgi:drug/metabolite transporter (DMT)-like permease
LFGFTAILGRLIHLTELEIVWYRVLLTSLSIPLLPGMINHIKAIRRTDMWRLAGIGVIVATHWVCFYGGIKYANVTVTLAVMSTTAFFTAFFEPLIFKTKLKKSEILLGAMIIPGMFLIFRFGQVYLIGILLSLAAAILAALFTILNRKMAAKYRSLPITFVELGAGWVFLTLVAPFYISYFPAATFMPTLHDFGWLLVLALVCTTFAYSLAVSSLRQVTAFTFNISINLEPVYGIIMAVIIFQEHEQINTAFYLGTAIILAAILTHTLMERRRKKRAAGIIQ